MVIAVPVIMLAPVRFPEKAGKSSLSLDERPKSLIVLA